MMLPPAMIAQAQVIVTKWLPLYPRDPAERPWVNLLANQAQQAAEDEWLATFNGLASLSRVQVEELISWKWGGYAPGRKRARDGISTNWGQASRCIRSALRRGASPSQAIDSLREKAGGVPGWQTSMSSVVLAACRPSIYSVADSRALKTIKLLKGYSQKDIDSTAWFPPSWWTPYISTCQALSQNLGVSLRNLDRALWASKGRL
jgi:hypothetical protein